MFTSPLGLLVVHTHTHTTHTNSASFFLSLSPSLPPTFADLLDHWLKCDRTKTRRECKSQQMMENTQANPYLHVRRSGKSSNLFFKKGRPGARGHCRAAVMLLSRLSFFFFFSGHFKATVPLPPPLEVTDSRVLPN